MVATANERAIHGKETIDNIHVLTIDNDGVCLLHLLNLGDNALLYTFYVFYWNAEQ